MAENRSEGILQVLDTSKPHTFQVPSKRINEGEDVNSWLTSWAYTDLMTFILQLNAAVFPQKKEGSAFQAWTLDNLPQHSSVVQGLRDLVHELDQIVEEAPPDPGPRRFGNVSFRTWFKIVEERLDALMEKYVPSTALRFDTARGTGEVSPKDELKEYLLGSFGSAQRLDYGTGHELSFIAFLGGIWKLGGFSAESDLDQGGFGTRERELVLGVIEPYLELIRKLILTYSLEPAGSHGVWGLDDHFFIPYIFGSAQLSPPIISPAEIPQEGSIPDAPRPGDVTKQSIVTRERKSNMYFSAIGFIYDVKKGPFWEHSPMLFDISGVTAGWAKINKGMIKMYNVEVLSKFPVVQHFPFGSIFRWVRNPDAPMPVVSTHTASQPHLRHQNGPARVPTGVRPAAGRAATAVPRTAGPTHTTNTLPGPTNSWTGQPGAMGLPATRAPWVNATSGAPPLPSLGGTTAPWAKGGHPGKPVDGRLSEVDESSSGPP